MVSLQLSSARWDPHKNRDTTYRNIVDLFQEDSVNSSLKKQKKRCGVRSPFYVTMIHDSPVL